MSKKHTPAPWYQAAIGNEDNTDEADARLREAAPELLEALQASNEFIRRMINEGFIHPSDLQEAGEIQANNYTAIQKAEGE